MIKVAFIKYVSFFVGHLVHYGLFLYDSLRNQPLECLDDLVYLLKSLMAFFELISSLFVIFVGLKESWIGNWSSINIAILVFHWYYNVFGRIQSGWKSFILRQVSWTQIIYRRGLKWRQVRWVVLICVVRPKDPLHIYLRRLRGFVEILSLLQTLNS